MSYAIKTKQLTGAEVLELHPNNTLNVREATNTKKIMQASGVIDYERLYID